MSTDAAQPGAPLTDQERDRAIEESEAWVLDYLDRVPFERLHLAMAEQACSQVALALGPRYGRTAASRVLEVLVATASPEDEGKEDIQRRMRQGDVTLLRDSSVEIDWQDLAADFAHLFAFARYGSGSHQDPELSRAEIEGLINHYRRVVANAGILAAAGTDVDWLVDTLAAAEARWAADHGRSVSPEHLAALAGVKPKTIANLLAARDLSTDTDGRIPAVEALRYLQRREGFIRSNWQYPVQPSPALGTDDAPSLGQQVFVPVDGNSNPFQPSIARRGRDGIFRYAIGAKSDPEYVEDYWEALDRLSRMTTPRWRRPPSSGKGGWSLVTGQEGWRRFARRHPANDRGHQRRGSSPVVGCRPGFRSLPPSAKP